MSDEQQPHRPEPGSGWQPMPHGPEYDAEATAFVQLPPDHSHHDPAALAGGGWDPLAAPGTGYTPPPMTGAPGAPSQGGQWQPTAHAPGAPADQSGTGHWTMPVDAGADASGQWAQPGAGGNGDSGEYAYGEHQNPHAQHSPHDQWQPQQPGRTGQWTIPFAADDGVDETGVYPVNDQAAAAQWPVPEAAANGQWTIPAAADDGVDETGEYRVDEHPGPATRPYGGPDTAQDTAQWTTPFADGAPGQHPQQPGRTGQWPVPAAGDNGAGGADDSGEYALGDHAVRSGPAPAAPPASRGPARRRLRLPGGADVPVGHPGAPTPAGGSEVPEVDDWPEELTHGAQSAASAAGHTAQATPPHGVAPVGGRGGFADDAYDGYDGYGAQDGPVGGGAVGVDDHTGPGTPPHGVAPVGGRGGFADDAYEAYDGYDAEDHAGRATPPHGVAAAAPEAPQAPVADEAPHAPAEPDPGQDAESAELAPDGHGAPLAEETAPEVAEPDTPEAQATADTLDAPEALEAPNQAAPEAADAAETLQTDSEHPSASYVLHVNGADRPVTDAWIGESLLYVLRERLGLAGAKDGCSQGECGACSVQVDGRLVASCLVPAATAAGCEVRTVEGLAVDGQPSDVQRALAACGAVQCGFCVPGMAMTVHDLLEGNHSPTDLQTRQAISGNLCRCSGYRGVVDAVREVVEAREAAAAAAAEEDEAADGGQEAAARIPHQAGPPGMNGTGDGGFDGSGSGTGSGRATA
ncbi:2Fe-2S iron-sulfur cluster-binding protein [Streptomyces sp. NPDC021225]|uniref:2Fe-2S iron-sulfur cluster-binding protein n=1 Tax=Streptomyces sp. NPDC021225 TaxID=3365121 RepID=UPI0037AE3515